MRKVKRNDKARITRKNQRSRIRAKGANKRPPMSFTRKATKVEFIPGNKVKEASISKSHQIPNHDNKGPAKTTHNLPHY